VAALASYIAPHGAKVWYYGAREPYCFVYLVDPRRSPHNVMLSSPLHVAAGTTCLYLLNQVRSFVAKTPTRKKRKKRGGGKRDGKTEQVGRWLRRPAPRRFQRIKRGPHAQNQRAALQQSLNEWTPSNSKKINIQTCHETNGLLTKETGGVFLERGTQKVFLERGTQKGVLISDSYQGKQLTVQGKDTLTHNDAKKIKLH
jgi:hypothetical protein